MKKSVGILALLVAAPNFAQEVGQVLSATPIVRQVAAPRQVCRTETVAYQEPKSGTGALMGAIAGGAVGNAVGDGAGRAAATMIGIIGGAALGDTIESSPVHRQQQVQHCEWQQVYENQTAGYLVVYQYAGRNYTVEWPSDPGSTIALQVSPASAAPVTGTTITAPPGPAVIAYPVYAPPPIYNPAVQIYWAMGRWPGRYWHR